MIDDRPTREAEAWRAGWRAALEAAAAGQRCGCDVAARVAAIKNTNSAARYRLCPHPNCGAIVAAEILATEPPA
jgi:hypothetical protein